jgi:hypothetical protein
MSELQQTLRRLHDELRQGRRLAPEDRALLETALADIQGALQAEGEPDVSSTEHGETLESAAVRLETEHPAVATAIRAVLDALAKAGI